MSEVYVVHIADVHLASSRDEVLKWAPDIAAALQGHVTSCCPIILAITGDLTDKGEDNQIGLGIDFISTLRDELKKRFSPSHFVLLLEPGNHDLDHTSSTKGRTELITQSENPLNHEYASILLKPIVRFLSASKAVEESNTVPIRENTASPYWRQLVYNFDGTVLSVCLLNSTVVSQVKEQPGKLLVEIPQDIDVSDASVSIVSLHHPLNWLKPSVKSDLTQFLIEHADIVITAHEHYKDSYQIERELSSITTIEAGALYTGMGNPSDFRLLRIDTNAKQVNICAFSRSTKGVYLPDTQRTDYSFARSAKQSAHTFRFTPKYKESLDSIGAPVTHPLHRNLALEDVFVMPDLRDTGNTTKPGSERVVKGRDVIKYIIDKKKVIVAGADRSGKSCLCKNIQRQLLARGVVPVKLAGSQLSSHKLDDLRDLIAKEVERQYGQSKSIDFLQRDNSLKAIVVDDWHRTLGLVSARDAIAKTLAEFSSHVVLITGNTADADTIQLAVGDATELYKYARLQVLPFGASLREELVRKWLSLGRDGGSEDDLDEEVIKLTRSIDEIIRDLVVPFPFEILAILQSHDSPSNKTHVGSLGRIYDTMITTSLLQVGVKPSLLNTMFTYLESLAFYLYGSKITFLDDVGYKEWNGKHEKQYAIQVDSTRYLDILRSAGILQVEDGEISFRYRYVYCFFVAKYLATKFRDTNVQEIIQELLAHVEHDDSAHVLAFLCYSTNDARIIDSLIELAGKSFSDYKELDFDGVDIQYVNNCGRNANLQMNPGESASKNRQERLKNSDRETEEQRSKQAAKSDPARLTRPSKSVTSASFNKDYRNAFRLIGIVGQTLRSHSGSLESGPKLQLAKTAYSLALRAEAARISYAEHDRPIVQSAITKVLKAEKRELSDGEANMIAESIIYLFAVLGTSSAITSVSSSITAKELSVTLLEVAKLSQSGPHEIINLAVKLEQSASPPVKLIEALEKKLRGNKYAIDVLRQLVTRHLYLFNTKKQVRQELFSLLDLGIPESRLLDPRNKRV